MSTIFYELMHCFSQQGTAFYRTLPKKELSLAEAAELLLSCPLDIFWHRYFLLLLEQASDEEIAALPATPEIQAVLAEFALQNPSFGNQPQLSPQLAAFSPEVDLRLALQAEQNSTLLQIFWENIFCHKPLISAEFAAAISQSATLTAQNFPPKLNLAAIKEELELPPPLARISPMETYKKAMGILYGYGFISGAELRHLASLSPWGLFRKWRFNAITKNGRNDFVLSGEMTSYGRGLSLEQARASLAMEMVERICAFADCDEQKILGRKNQLPLIRGSFAELQGKNALNPDSLSPEVPYAGQKIYWTAAEKIDENGSHSALVPVQAVFLFSNLDEAELFAAVGSTGLAAGNTIEEAKVAALLEIIERDCEQVTPFSETSCFRLASNEALLADLLEKYKNSGIDLCFQDISGHLGVPTFKAFVKTADGEIVKATGANLDSRAALVSAMTEVPYPFPDSPDCRASALGGENLPVKNIADFPSFDTGSFAGNLQLLETAITRFGHEIFYVDISRKDISLPVIRAFITGLDYMADCKQRKTVPSRFVAAASEMLF